MNENRSGFLSKPAAMRLIELSGQYWRGALRLPPEIEAKKREIAAATKNAALFMSRTGVVDNGMIYHVVDLKIELDGLYAQWAESEVKR